ncbi:quinone-dependent dihydroorotate dehydrogenase [Parvularcula dongshanensis]|uniref:Dihydroorotate dehydrogenase (quinone) n=1 Tax=Parvularcula dongshanensis TaxID=1173995 RepID=A0A840I1M6_9PROT|nr:quinone-dependent dihydroorotate dehydrogenase [Parvularcula dongshanensis]MBB4658183.1 dihydroorotate dehydrogenase [Parvularcula dongshanensis]
MIAGLGAKALRALDPETAHRATIALLKAGLGPKPPVSPDPMLRMTVAGIDFANPLGLAAGFDKNAEAPDACLAMGFGFVEVGAATPRPQAGNPRPRVFRLRDERGVINRYGFNNDGLDAIGSRLASRAGRPGIVGVNLGANKDSEDRAADYVAGYEALAPHAAFCTVNISSPNTPGLRALQGRRDLEALLARVLAVKGQTPVFLKVAPDLTDADKADIAGVARDLAIDALIVSNTTIGGRDGLSRHGAETGGLSGKPLFPLSTEVLRDFARTLRGAVPLIGVGGVASARDAYEKVAAGASLVQLYTALIYEGPGLPARIVAELPAILRAEGHDSLAAAVGCKL